MQQGLPRYILKKCKRIKTFIKDYLYEFLTALFTKHFSQG